MGYFGDLYGYRSKDFVDGVIAGIEAYAVWENGEQYLGVMKRPLKEEVEEVKRDLLEGYETAKEKKNVAALSISDDDLCAECQKLIYYPGNASFCIQEINGQWPAKFDNDGYAVECVEFQRIKTYGENLGEKQSSHKDL